MKKVLFGPVLSHSFLLATAMMYIYMQSLSSDDDACMSDAFNIRLAACFIRDVGLIWLISIHNMRLGFSHEAASVPTLSLN